MKRTERILKYADTNGKGIEVAPYYNAIVPKREGYDVLILDVFDTEKLRNLAAADPNIPNDRVEHIEPVDIVGDASQLINLIEEMKIRGAIDYIVSSHNFEHLPNPILFLKGAEEALKVGGILSLTVPDCRACFDHFRMPSRLSDWLEAYHDGRTQPSPETVFDQFSLNAPYVKDGVEHPGASLAFGRRKHFLPAQNLRQCYDEYVQRRSDPGQYRDAHCNVFFPEIFELLIRDLHYLGLINFEVVEVSKTIGLEFDVHLRRTASRSEETGEIFFQRRDALLRKISENLGAAPFMKRDSKLVRRVWVRLRTELRDRRSKSRARRRQRRTEKHT